MKNVECKTKRNVHRVCFDFNEAEEAIDFEPRGFDTWH